MTNFSACSNFNQDVYGPPVREWEQEETSYDPEENQNANVYGPPEREEWEYEETDTEIVSNDDTTQSEEEISPDTSEETQGDEQQ
ncbi:MAG: hypothetical protein K2J76_08400 [Oscillospiraceae bacterium]|nr:hypothetical protein [Oscillospiraceae bacterium]